ncbi:glycosyltransferase, partial [Candidatus Saccharibacteria bacterium]|nr:glycosyltransferase [Candidatus Saccharibacteria bacterium]
MKTKILSVGGGSGGHVTPVVAVLHEIKRENPDAELRFWSDKKFGSQAKRILADFSSDLRFSTIFSGKFRRYSHLTRLQHFTKYDVVFPNIRDAFFVILGFFESLIRLIIWRPNAVFLKGGYVC